MTGKSPAIHPLSLNQQRMWAVERRSSKRGLFNNDGAYRLPGDISPSALRRAVEHMSARHPALNTTFSERDGIPIQVVHDRLPPDFREIRVKADNEAELKEILDAQASEFLDPERGPLMRWVLISIHGQRPVLFIMTHHIIADGWSAFTMLSELGALYRQEMGESPANLPALKHTYHEFIREQNDWCQSPEAQRERLFWQERLSRHIGILALPTDRPRRAAPSFKTGVFPFAIPVALQKGMRALAKDSGVRPLTAWLSAWFVFLHRLTGQKDLVTTVPVAGRARKYAGVVGLSGNTVPVRVRCVGQARFRTFLKQSADTLEASLAHRNLPVPLIVQGASRHMITALSQTKFAWQNYNFPGRRGYGRITAQGEAGEFFHLGGMRWELIRFWRQPDEMEFQLWIINLPDNQYGLLYYSSDLFERSTIARWSGHFIRLVEGIVAKPETRLSQLLPLFTEAEQQRFLKAKFNTLLKGLQAESDWSLR
uniref:Condensation domain-containing protein n=1 Tax=Candidatus Kentrum sp. FW TaxID=2126338 RepID=A0A450U1C0_9GAMM|nr:MAG: Condensation domain-containing protein [Candidatus Kentron sp. FW]